MKKLLLIMLVPVLVLGVMACSKDYTTDTEVDAYIQGAWDSLPGGGATWLPSIGTATADVELFFTANEVTIRYESAGEVFSKPYHVELDHFGAVGLKPYYTFPSTYDTAVWDPINPPATGGQMAFDDVNSIMGFFGIVADDTKVFKTRGFDRVTAATLGDDYTSNNWYSLLGEAFVATGGIINPRTGLTDQQIVGKLTIFNYEDRVEIATVGLIYSGDWENPRNGAKQQLSVINIQFAEDVPWYMLDIPLRVGIYNVRPKP